MPFSLSNIFNKHRSSSSKKTRDRVEQDIPKSTPILSRRQRGGNSRNKVPPTSIAPRESSLYSNNFSAAAASTSCLPYTLFEVSTGLVGGTQNRTSSLPVHQVPSTPPVEFNRPRFNFSSIDIRSVSPPSQRFGVYFEDDEDEEDLDIPSPPAPFIHFAAIKQEDFAVVPTSTGGAEKKRSLWKPKAWASKSVIGLVRSKMSMSRSRVDLNAVGDDDWLHGDNDMVDAPPVPLKSHLRASHILHQSTPYTLSVAPPLDNTTPSLSSSSSDDGDVESHTSASPEIQTPASASGGSWSKRGKRQSTVGDPYRIRDGAPTRESSSGVYTPTTFPGAQGPRPSHFPSHVYTPSGFQLYGPGTNGDGPSRSSSLSSKSTDRSPSTPTSPMWNIAGGRLSSLSNGIKRISTSFTFDRSMSSSSSSGASTPASAPYTISSATDSYFPSSKTTYHTRTTSWTTGTAASDTSALGLEPVSPPPFTRNRASMSPEVKRKPVPKLDEVVVEIAKMDVVGMEDDRDDLTPTPTSTPMRV